MVTVYISIYRPVSVHLEKMWHLIPTILCLTYGEATHHYPAPYQIVQNSQQPNGYPYSYDGSSPYNYVVNPGAVTAGNNYPLRPPQYANTYTEATNPSGYYRNGNHLRQSMSQYQLRAPALGSDPLDFDYGSSDSNTDTDIKVDEQTYFTDLELVKNFGNYLIQLMPLNGSSSAINDVTHQYSALFAVLVALARAIRNSCTTDFDVVYDQVYPSTVDTYYKYGLANAEKVAAMVEDYIRKGNLHIYKLKKLKQEYCENEPFCSAILDKKIKSYPLLFVRELESLEAVAHLTQSYYSYRKEFNEAAHKGNVLTYLQNSKDRLKEYVMHIVNSIDHLTDKAVTCP